MTDITLKKGGEGETTIKAADINVPDLWHIAGWLEGEAIRRRKNGLEGAELLDTNAKAILDTWHLAHDLKNHIVENDTSTADLGLSLHQAAMIGFARATLQILQSEHDWSADTLDQISAAAIKAELAAAPNGYFEVQA
jgi:hypothetical protein